MIRHPGLIELWGGHWLDPVTFSLQLLLAIPEAILLLWWRDRLWRRSRR